MFVDGWLNLPDINAWGRPTDVLVMKDGSILISDDKANAIYVVRYEGANATTKAPNVPIGSGASKVSVCSLVLIALFVLCL